VGGGPPGKLESWEVGSGGLGKEGCVGGSGPPYDWVGPGGRAVENGGWETGGTWEKDCWETGGGAWGWVGPVEEKGWAAFGKGCWAGGGAP